MTSVPISMARVSLPQFANTVAFGHERIVVARRGEDLCALVSMKDLELLERLEDQYWAKEGQKALAEFEASGEKAIPLEQVRKDLGL